MSKTRRNRRSKNSLLGLWIGLGILGGVVLVVLILLLVTQDSKDSSPTGNYRAVLGNTEFVPSNSNAIEVDIAPQKGSPNPAKHYVLVVQQNRPAGPIADEQTVPHDVLIRGGRQRVETSIEFRSNSTYHLSLFVYTTKQRSGRRLVSNSLFFEGPKN